MNAALKDKHAICDRLRPKLSIHGMFRLIRPRLLGPRLPLIFGTKIDHCFESFGSRFLMPFLLHPCDGYIGAYSKRRTCKNINQ